jgi:hypothetical protein
VAAEIRAAQVAAGDAEEVAAGLRCDEIAETSRPQPIEPLSPEAWCEAILSTVVVVEQV